MHNSKIYHYFYEKIGNREQSNQKIYRIIISFNSLTDRDNFIKKENDLEIIKIFEIIPAICVKSTIKEIFYYEKSTLIKQIEQDQELFLNLKEINKMFNVDSYKKSQINYTGKGIRIGLIDASVQTYFESFFDNLQGKKRVKKQDTEHDEFMLQNNVTHGTLIGNIIVNRLRDKNNIRLGIAPDAEIIDFSLSKFDNSIFMSDMIEIFQKIHKNKIGMDILLISYSTKTETDGNDILCTACERLAEEGIIIIAPVENTLNKNQLSSPAASNYTISVRCYESEGITNTKLSKNADFQFLDQKIIIPLTNDLDYKVVGNSVWAAITAGFIACLKEHNREYTLEDIREIIKGYQEKWGDLSSSFDFVKLFKYLGIYSPKLTPYTYILKRSIWISLEILIILILLFFWKEIFNLIKIIYGF